MAGIKDNIQKILSGLPGHVELVAAAKGRRIEEILEAASGGVKIIGENYIQEAEEKFNAIGRKVKWHFIGHLQKNKVRLILEDLTLIHSVDSFELTQEIDKRARSLGKVQELLVELNLSTESSKSGCAPSEIPALVRGIASLENVRLKGLMAIPPFLPEPEQVRPFFRRLKKILDDINVQGMYKGPLGDLSIGMTHDFEVAIEEGATIVRIGTGIFGPREP